MRELKFKAYTPEIGMSAPFRLGVKHIMVTFDDCGSYYALSGLPHSTIFLQSTNLKDKNEIPIYEGDIINAENSFTEFEYTNLEVKWDHEDALAWCFAKEDIWWYLADLGCFEVIGNIHEGDQED